MSAPKRIAASPRKGVVGWARGSWSLPYGPDAKGAVAYVRADLVPQWRPIETAPDDGTPILLREGALVGEGAFLKKQGWRPGRWAFFKSRAPGNPTHWQPLPEPADDA